MVPSRCNESKLIESCSCISRSIIEYIYIFCGSLAMAESIFTVIANLFSGTPTHFWAETPMASNAINVTNTNFFILLIMVCRCKDT